VDALLLDEILQARKDLVPGAEHNDERTLSVGLMKQSGLHRGLRAPRRSELAQFPLGQFDRLFEGQPLGDPGADVAQLAGIGAA
jgi:hypothetical protein